MGETEKRTNLARNTVLCQEISSTGSGEDVVSSRVQLLNRRQDLDLLLVAADREQDILLRQDDTRRNQRLKVSLVLVPPETSHLSCRRHLDAQDRVGTRETAEAELRHLNTDIVGRQGHMRVRFDWHTEHDLRRHLNRVDPSDLRDERERTSRAQVALDDLDLVVLCNELDIERSSNI